MKVLTRRASGPAALLGLVLAAAMPAQGAPYQGMLVLGDSLSDNGNNAALGLYNPGQTVTGNTYVGTFSYGPAATYSNGPVWVNYLADDLGISAKASFRGGSNFANGGALLGDPGVGPFGYPFSLKVQTERFLSAVGGVAPADVLYVVAGGGNDAKDALGQIGTLPLGTPAGDADAMAIFEAVGRSMVEDITSIVDALQFAGAQDIIVWNLPNLGLVPAVTTARGRSIAAAVTAAWNDQIELALAGEPGVTVFDLYGLSTDLAANAVAYGIVNVRDACGAAPSGTDCATYMWWDGIHPTTRAHELLADEMGAVVAGLHAGSRVMASALSVSAAADPVPEPMSAAILAFGASALAVASRRRRAR